MDLNPREIVFLQYLSEETQYRPLSYYAQKMKVTVRTLRTDLKNLEQYLKSLNIKLERKSGLGIYLGGSAGEKAALTQILQADGRRSPYMTPGGRRLEILRMLLWDGANHLSVQKLSEQYFVSPASIVNDLKYVEKWLFPHGPTLLRDSAGTRLQGSEVGIRRAMAAFIEENGFENAAQLQAFEPQKIDRMTVENLRNLFPDQEIRFLEGLLNSLEKQCGYVIGEPYYLNLLTHLLIVVKRVSLGYRTERLSGEERGEWRNTPAYKYAEKMAGEMEAYFNIEMGEEEICYIYRYFISFGIGTNENLAAGCRQTGDRLAEEIMRWTGEAMAADFVTDGNLKSELKLYVRSMINRIRYNIPIKNNLLPGIQNLYPELLAYLEGVIWCLGGAYGLGSVSRDETAYISMYCQAAAAASQKRPKALIVCQSGYGTSQVLMTRLAQAFPSLEAAGVTSVRLLRETDLSEYSFLISTVRLQALPIPHIVISPLLSEADIRKIQASGLLAESGREEDGGKRIREWFFEGKLEVLREPECWSGWEERVSQGSPEECRHISGGFLDVILIGKAARTKMYLFPGKDGRGEKAVIEGRYPKDMLPLLAGCYQMASAGFDFYRLDDYYQEHEFLRSVLPDSHIITGRHFETKDEVIKSLSELLFRQGAIPDAEAFCRDVFTREMEGITAIEEDVAMPHGQAGAMSLAMAVLPSPVSWGVYEGEVIRVRIVVLFAVRSKDVSSRNSDYFKALSIIGKALDSSGKRERLFHAESGEKALELLTRSLRDNEEEI